MKTYAVNKGWVVRDWIREGGWVGLVKIGWKERDGRDW